MKGNAYLRVFLLGLSVIEISLLHYLTPLHLPQLHDLFQRLYYFPIIFAAFWFGIRGGLCTSIAVSILYVPHILFQWQVRPSLELEKFLEIVLYNVVGGITGYLSQREEMRREELRRTAEGLQESYRKLQGQADLIISIEEQLRRAERLSAAGELSAVLAHEIRNPLGSIKGTAEILRDDYSPGDRKYEFLQILLKETDRLNTVVEDFLGLARPGSPAEHPFDVSAELSEVAALSKPEAEARGVRILFSAAAPCIISGDREKLRQAFLNLTLNGLQATPRGGSLSITVEPAEGNSVKIVFSDTGTGIAAENLERIFRPFFSTRRDGTGLGLAITQKIVEGHGGRISVESEPGRGTTFRMVLPVRRQGEI
jgi:two-component system, NtrC family, sensor histidine kinase HydH